MLVFQTAVLFGEMVEFHQNGTIFMKMDAFRCLGSFLVISRGPLISMKMCDLGPESNIFMIFHHFGAKLLKTPGWR